MHGLVTIFWKELADHFASKRFVILFLLIYLAGISAIYVAGQTIRGQVTETTEFVFLMLFTVSPEGWPFFVSPFLLSLSIFVSIMGIAFGFDAISSERTSGNLSRLLSQPVYRDSVINAKFLAGLATLAILLISIIAIVAGMGLRMIGVPPSSEEVLRLIVFLIISVVYGAFWLALANLFSIYFGAIASVLAAVSLWVFLFLFMFLIPVIPGVVADIGIPVDQNSSVELITRHLEIRDMVGRISPCTLYGEATQVLLTPELGTPSLSLMIISVYTAGTIPTPLPFDQSLLLIWPHLTSLVALSALCFAASYIRFMREEIRSV